MPKSYIVTVTTEDGTLLVRREMPGDSSFSLSALSQLFQTLSQASEVTEPLRIERGSIIPSSVCSSPHSMEY